MASRLCLASSSFCPEDALSHSLSCRFATAEFFQQLLSEKVLMSPLLSHGIFVRASRLTGFLFRHLSHAPLSPSARWPENVLVFLLGTQCLFLSWDALKLLSLQLFFSILRVTSMPRCSFLRCVSCADVLLSFWKRWLYVFHYIWGKFWPFFKKIYILFSTSVSFPWGTPVPLVCHHLTLSHT